MAITATPCNVKATIIFCLCLFVVPSIQATYFQPCYYNVNYPVRVEEVSVFSDPNNPYQGVSVRYFAYSDLYIRQGRVSVNTFLTSESAREEQHISETHPLCKDTKCPIKPGNGFSAEFHQRVPRDTYGSKSLLVRLVDNFSGRELTCFTVDFDTYDWSSSE